MFVHVTEHASGLPDDLLPETELLLISNNRRVRTLPVDLCEKVKELHLHNCPLLVCNALPENCEGVSLVGTHKVPKIIQQRVRYAAIARHQLRPAPWPMLTSLSLERLELKCTITAPKLQVLKLKQVKIR
jgi:hypothetical protein